jgi:hypothetical protein
MDELEHYLDQVCRGIGGPSSLPQHIRQELREHLVDAAAEFREAGLSDAEALARALESFGGPAQIGSELAATHGHRLLATVIDKAIDWKERTMKAKWLWSSWAFLAVLALLALELFSITFGVVYLVPKYQYCFQKGWIQSENSAVTAFLSWARSFLQRLELVADYATGLALAAAVAWGLFEWRVRGENKSFMRLALLGSDAVALLIILALMSAALVISFEIAIPEIVSLPPQRIFKQQVTRIDATLAAVEMAQAEKDWQAALQATARLLREIESLSHVGAAAAFEPHLKGAKKSLERALEAIQKLDAKALDIHLQEFRHHYTPIHDAVLMEHPPES